jgi:hypothetical protein
MRRPYGGASWTGLIATVLVLVLVWAMVRLFAGSGPTEFTEAPPVLNGSAGLSQRNSFDQPVPPSGPQRVGTTVTAVSAGAHVEVRDGDGNLVFEGDLVIGQSKHVRAMPPVTVTSDNGSAVSVRLAGKDQGMLGTAEEPVTRTFQSDQPARSRR